MPTIDEIGINMTVTLAADAAIEASLSADEARTQARIAEFLAAQALANPSPISAAKLARRVHLASIYASNAAARANSKAWAAREWAIKSRGSDRAIHYANTAKLYATEAAREHAAALAAWYPVMLLDDTWPR